MEKTKKETKNKNILKIKMNFEGFNLDLISDNPNKTLSELNKLVISKRKLIESINYEQDFELEEIFEEDNIGFEFKARMLSKELKFKKNTMEKVRTLVLAHGNFIYRKERIDIKKEIDFNNKSLRLIIDKKELISLTKKILFRIDKNKIKHIIIHIIGENIKENHKYIIKDQLRKSIGTDDNNIILTKKDVGEAIVFEALVFGQFPETNTENQ